MYFFVVVWNGISSSMRSIMVYSFGWEKFVIMVLLFSVDQFSIMVKYMMNIVIVSIRFFLSYFLCRCLVIDDSSLILCFLMMCEVSSRVGIIRISGSISVISSQGWLRLKNCVVVRRICDLMVQLGMIIEMIISGMIMISRIVIQRVMLMSLVSSMCYQ